MEKRENTKIILLRLLTFPYLGLRSHLLKRIVLSILLSQTAKRSAAADQFDILTICLFRGCRQYKIYFKMALGGIAPYPLLLFFGVWIK